LKKIFTLLILFFVANEITHAQPINICTGYCTKDCDPNPYNKDPMTHLCTVSCLYQSDFGDPLNIDEAATYDYIAARAATFFQAILGGVASASPASVTAKFVECQNFRNKCLGTETTCSTDECP